MIKKEIVNNALIETMEKHKSKMNDKLFKDLWDDLQKINKEIEENAVNEESYKFEIAYSKFTGDELNFNEDHEIVCIQHYIDINYVILENVKFKKDSEFYTITDFEINRTKTVLCINFQNSVDSSTYEVIQKLICFHSERMMELDDCNKVERTLTINRTINVRLISKN